MSEWEARGPRAWETALEILGLGNTNEPVESEEADGRPMKG